MMNSVNDKDETLRRLVTQFRLAMESTDFLGTRLEEFPKEVCDITCRVLGLYLFSHGFINFFIFSGARPDCDDGKHLWLQVEDIIVDITADQFDDSNQPSVVVTRDSAWHAALDGKIYMSFDNDYYQLLVTEDSSRFTREVYDKVLLKLGYDDEPISTA